MSYQNPFVAFALFLTSWFIACQGSSAVAADDLSKPNILVILVDDMGFSDVGCFGGEIETPRLDRLAENGLRFSNFYNTARCWPTRASLLTGFYAQQVRRDAFSKDASGGNQGTRPNWAPLLPELLKPAGYASFHSGKWHLDGEPLQCGFDHSYKLLDDNRHFNPNRHQLDGLDLPKVARDAEYYSTRAITDHMLQFLENHQTTHQRQPFFGYLAYIAPHFPLQAPQKTIKKYKTKYVSGWDQIRRERFERQQKLGFNFGASLGELESAIGPPYAFPNAIKQLGSNEVNRELPWNSLTIPQQEFQATKMAIHAAMVDEVDQQLGRVVDWLTQNGHLDNTLIVFLSDNGASAEIMVRGDGHSPEAEPGSAESFLCLGPGWSRCANTPFRRHKTWVHEGGISTSMIVHWPASVLHNGIRQQVGHVNCIVPTLLDAAGLPTHPQFKDGPTEFSGISLLPAIQMNEPSNSMETVWFLHEENKALRQGDWKIVKAANEDWQLYHLKDDRMESNNLANLHRDKLSRMISIWDEMNSNYLEQTSRLAK